MRVMHLLSTFSAIMLPLVCLNVLPYCLSQRVEEKFEECQPEGRDFSTNKPDKLIINGTKENIKNFPFTVQLHHELANGTLDHQCGGSVISKRFVLTAAHCVNKKGIIIVILAGSTKLNDGKRYEIELVKIHPSYALYPLDARSYADADVAVLRTSTEIKFTDFVKAVKLPTPGQEIKAGKMAQVLGWGDTSDSASSYSPHLMRVDVPIVSYENCKRAYPTLINKYMLCAGYKEGMKGICMGDSGGPLVVDATLFGIVSWGNPCARPNCPDVFVKVSEVIDWITNITGKII